MLKKEILKQLDQAEATLKRIKVIADEAKPGNQEQSLAVIASIAEIYFSVN